MERKESIMLSLICALLIAVMTDWTIPAKLLVIVSALSLAVSAIDGLVKEIKKVD